MNAGLFIAMLFLGCFAAGFFIGACFETKRQTPIFLALAVFLLWMSIATFGNGFPVI